MVAQSRVMQGSRNVTTAICALKGSRNVHTLIFNLCSGSYLGSCSISPLWA